MKILIITRSFVREVNELVRYIVHHSELPWTFHLVFPHDAHLEDSLPASVSMRRMYWSRQIRTACYGPSLLIDFWRFQPDIVQVFEEFSGLLAFQSFVLRSLVVSNSKALVYSAENILHNVRPVLRPSMRYVMKRASLAFVCSHGVKDVLLQEVFPAPIEVFPLGVDTNKFYKFPVNRLKRQLKLDEKFVIGYVGRLCEFKGVFLLLDLMRRLPEHVHLLLIGSGPEEQSLIQRADSYGIKHRVHFAGAISYKELPRYMNCIDVGIIPSLTTPYWKEQFGRVAIEFMSSEVPVIASDSGSLPEVLGEAGRLFPVDNVQELLQSLNSFMNDHDRLIQLGQAGRKLVQQEYSIKIMSQRFVEMYYQLMG